MVLFIKKLEVGQVNEWNAMININAYYDLVTYTRT